MEVELLNTRWVDFLSPSSDSILVGFTLTSLPCVTDCENHIHSSLYSLVLNKKFL